MAKRLSIEQKQNFFPIQISLRIIPANSIVFYDLRCIKALKKRTRIVDGKASSRAFVTWNNINLNRKKKVFFRSLHTPKKLPTHKAHNRAELGGSFGWASMKRKKVSEKMILSKFLVTQKAKNKRLWTMKSDNLEIVCQLRKQKEDKLDDDGDKIIIVEHGGDCWLLGNLW